MYLRHQRLSFIHFLVMLCVGVYLLPSTAFAQADPKIYWIDESGSSIQRANPDGSGVETIVSDLGEATSLAIDTNGGRVFWCEKKAPSRDYKISSIDLDGSGNIYTLPIDFAKCDKRVLIDANPKIYFSGGKSKSTEDQPSSHDGLRTYYRANLDGSNEELVLEGELGPVYGIAGDYLFFASMVNARRDSTVNYRKNVTTGVEEPFESRFKSLGRIVDDTEEEEMYFYARHQLYRSDYAGNNIEALSEVRGISNLDIDVQGRRLFWVANGTIETADLNGNNRSSIITANPVDIAAYAPDQSAPIITSNPVTAGIVGELYTYDVEAVGNPNPGFSLEIGPESMEIDSVTGEISWTPEEVGSYDVTVVASNGVEPDASQSYTIEVTGTAPEITSNPVTNVALGDTYMYDVEATGNPDPGFSLEVGPEGMTIDSGTGEISWSPDELGSYEVTVVASNGVEPDASQSFTIEVTGTPPTITSTPVTTVVLGETYAYDVSATGNPQQMFSLSLAPDGMTIDPNSGIISWTPSALGSVNVTVVATNGVSPDATQSFTVTVIGTAPAIISTPVTSVQIGASYAYDVNATGNPNPTYSLTNAPAGMAINASTGLISWTPAATGSFAVTVVATNGVSPDATQSFTVSVTGTAPAIVSSPVTAGMVNEGYTYDVNATGTPDPTYALSTAPAGMTIDAGSGLISWTPTEAGTFTVTVTASNGVAPVASQSYTLTIAPEDTAPFITSSPITIGMVGELYSYDVNAVGNPAPTYTLTTAPGGMNINPAGVITWTPSEAGTYSVTVMASNGIAPNATQSYTLTITPEESAPVITSTPVTVGMVNIAYSYDVNATGNPAPIFELITAPAGMTIDPAGVISWAPSEAGNYPVTVKASNGVAPDATQSFSITVEPEGGAPEIISTALTTAMLNQAYSYDVNATGDPAPTYALTTAPEGMTIDPLSGLITWTPEVEGGFPVTVTASNGVNPDASQTFFLVVTEANFAPTITSTPLTIAEANQLYTYDVNAAGNPTPTYALAEAPAGMSIDPVSGLISWTPNSSGDFEVTVEASNGIAPLASQSYTLTVTEEDFTPEFNSIPITFAVLNGLYTYDVEAVGNPAPTYSLLLAPEGMTIDPISGLISWTPTLAGVFEVTIVASNGVGPDVQQSFMLTVTEAEFAPVITSSPLTMALVNEAYTYAVQSTGSPAPTYSIDAPPGMTVDPVSGIITWTPENVGEFEVTVTASNGIMPDAIQSYTLIVTEEEFAPTITSEPITIATLNELYSYTVEATGNPDPIFSLVTAEEGMSIDPISGLITWVPESIGVFEVHVVASNGVLPDSEQLYTLTVTEGEFAPTITSDPVTVAVLNELYTYDVEATGNPEPTYSLSEAPAGMTINSMSGLISWTPTAGGDFEVTVIASNGILPDTEQMYTLTVTEGEFAPSITSDPVTMALLNEMYTYDVDATGNPVPAYSLTTGPEGMSIDPLSGVISWVPVELGDVEVVIVASNGLLPDAEQAFTLSVTEEEFAPTITSDPTTNAVTNEVYTYDIDATGNPAPTYSLTTAPEGMSIDPLSGIISWTPIVAGDYEVIVGASNGIVPDAEQSFMLTVTEQAFAPTIISSPVTMALVNEEYTYDVDATGNPEPLYSLDVAPEGMSIDPLSGVISWTPDAIGDFAVTVVASNGVVPNSEQAFTLVVTEAAFAPTIISMPATMVMVNEAYIYDVDATGNPEPAYSLVAAPEGMSIDGTTGVINWTPDAIGEFEVTILASNGIVPDAEQMFTLVVTEEEFAPTISSTPVNEVNLGDTYTYEVIATGNPAPTFSLDSAPDGMAIDETTGMISWTPTEEGVVDVIVRASNGVIPNALQSFMITVSPPVGTSEEEVEILEFELVQNYPNPFSVSTTIEYSLPAPDHVSLLVYDLLGRQVSVLHDSYRTEGKHRVQWEGQDERGSYLPAGIYFVKIETGSGESNVIAMMKLN